MWLTIRLHGELLMIWISFCLWKSLTFDSQNTLQSNRKFRFKGQETGRSAPAGIRFQLFKSKALIGPKRLHICSDSRSLSYNSWPRGKLVSYWLIANILCQWLAVSELEVSEVRSFLDSSPVLINGQRVPIIDSKRLRFTLQIEWDHRSLIMAAIFSKRILVANRDSR